MINDITRPHITKLLSTAQSILTKNMYTLHTKDGKMRADLLDRAMVDSDLGIVNAARCSFDKESTYDYVCTDETCTGVESCSREHITPVLKAADVKLIKYLAQHQHWTPFAHAQEAFKVNIRNDELLEFLLRANLAGFEWIDTSPWLVRGSLYAWLTNLQHLPTDIYSAIYEHLQDKYPISFHAFKRGIKARLESEDHSRTQAINCPTEPELTTYTSRIHCPIFVKRQLETHRRNFVMTDIEDFAQNEVSRRYIDTEPEIYTPEQWRIQSKEKKQGSTDKVIDDQIEKMIIDSNYRHHTFNAIQYYKSMNRQHIAHEQSRMILPLSVYTTFWWTGSLKSWQRMFVLRLNDSTQSETREVAQMCYDAINT